MIGLMLTAVHLVLALAINDDWSHAIAWRVTEERTREMFGFGWGGALLGNYAFIAVWAFDVASSRRALARRSTGGLTAGYTRQSHLSQWAFRAFVIGIIVPAAIVFASGSRRWLGMLVVAALFGAWRPLRR